MLYLAEQLVDLTGGTVQDKCDDQPDGDRPQDIEHIGEQSGEDFPLDEQERHQQQHYAAEDDCCRPLFVDKVPLADFFFVFLLRIRHGFGFVWFCCHNALLWNGGG